MPYPNRDNRDLPKDTTFPSSDTTEGMESSAEGWPPHGSLWTVEFASAVNTIDQVLASHQRAVLRRRPVQPTSNNVLVRERLSAARSHISSLHLDNQFGRDLPDWVRELRSLTGENAILEEELSGAVLSIIDANMKKLVDLVASPGSEATADRCV